MLGVLQCCVKWWSIPVHSFCTRPNLFANSQWRRPPTSVQCVRVSLVRRLVCVQVCPLPPCSVCYYHRIKMLHSGVDRWHSSNQAKPTACLCFAFETNNWGCCCALQQSVVWRSATWGCLRVVTCNSFGDVALRGVSGPKQLLQFWLHFSHWPVIVP